MNDKKIIRNFVKESLLSIYDNKNYGVIYAKICPKDKKNGSWIKYCHLISQTPQSFQDEMRDIVDYINKKYSLIIPMDFSVHPGCVSNVEEVDEVAKEIFEKLKDLAKKQGIENSIRCVYGIGELEDVNVESIHYLKPYEIMVKVGRFLDNSDEPGLFKIK